MSHTIALTARRVLAGALAAAALTTGVGLAGSGIAEAAPSHQTCLADVHGTVTIEDHGHIGVGKLGMPSHGWCSSPGQDSYPLSFGSAQTSDPKRSGYTTEGDAGGFVDAFDPATGAVDVILTGSVRNGPSAARPMTPGGYNSVALKGLRPGRGYEIDEVTVDGAGRKVSTRMFFDLETS